jgi:hypothetical protein
MPWRTLEATAVEIEDAARSNEHGSETSYTVLHVVAKIPKRELRPGGSFVYACLGLLYLPVLFDALWFVNGGNIKRAAPPPPPPVAPPTEAEDAKKNKRTKCCGLYREDKYCCCLDVEDDSLSDRLITRLCMPVFLPCLVGFGVLLFMRQVLAYGLGSLVLMIRNLLRALTCNLLGSFENHYVRIAKPKPSSDAAADAADFRINSPADFWELRTSVVYDGGNMFVPSPPFAIDELNVGDAFKCGFGPFESLCLFRGNGGERGGAPVDAFVAGEP